MSVFYWLYRWFGEEVIAIPGRVIAFCFIISLILFPLIVPNQYLLRILTLTAIFAIYAASWDVLAGFTGQFNMGQTLFFGVAAYTAALLNIHFKFPPWLTIPCGAIMAVIGGLIVGLPALRLRGFYLALVTLAFPVILSGIVFIFSDFTGGELGIFGVSRLSVSRTVDYYVILCTMLGSLWVMYKFTDAESKIVRIGVILRAIREDEIAARTSGIDTTKYKILAFGVSGFFAGVAGGLYAHYLRIAGPSTLELFFSFQALLWTIFGGMGTIYGAVVGVYLLYPLVELVSLHPVGEATRYALFAIILLFSMLFMPEGLTPWVRDRIEEICPRCKIVNISTRSTCRVCRAPLHLKKGDIYGKGGRHES